MDRKKVIVVGANGHISRQIIPLLLKNYQVHCLIRSPASFAINSIFLRFIEGDALSPETWDDCLQGKDAVISCFGVREGESEARELEFTNLLVQKMAEKGVKRFIGFYSYGAFKNHQGKHIYQSEGFGPKERAIVQSQCISALEHSELNFTALCLWKFQVGGGAVVGVENEWSETPSDSQGVVGLLRTQLQRADVSRKTIFIRNSA